MTIAMKNSGEGTPVVNESGQETTAGTAVSFISQYFSLYITAIFICKILIFRLLTKIALLQGTQTQAPQVNLMSRKLKMKKKHGWTQPLESHISQLVNWLDWKR